MTVIMTMKKQQEQAQKHACAERALVMPFRMVAGMTCGISPGRYRMV